MTETNNKKWNKIYWALLIANALYIMLFYILTQIYSY